MAAARVWSSLKNYFKMEQRLYRGTQVRST